MFSIPGSKLGGMDMLPWTETTAEHMKVYGLDRSKVYYITVTAVNRAGLYDSITFTTP